MLNAGVTLLSLASAATQTAAAYPAATAAAAAATATAGTSAYAARQQNKSIGAGMEAQARAAEINQRQLALQAGQQQQERIDEANQLAARIRVARGEAGVGLGGSTAAAVRQVDFDAARDLDTIDMNLLMGVSRVRTGTEAQMAQLESQTQNPLISAFLGGLQGASYGLQLGEGIHQLRERRESTKGAP